MGIYLLVFGIALIYFLVASGKLKKNSFLLAFFLLYLAVFIGLGDMIGGYDRYIYGETFDTIANATRTDGYDYSHVLYLVNGTEYGYFLWQIAISFFTSNRYIFILITILLMYVLYFLTMRKYIDNYPLACILFLGLFYYFTMTYLRQTLAIGIAWQGIRYIWERRAWKFFSIIAIAFLFHNSAGILALMYFLPIKKFSQSQILLVMLLCLVIGVSPMATLLLASAEDTTGKEGYSQSEMVGFRWEYLLEVVFFLWIFLRNYKYIATDRKTLTFLNMSFVFCAILLIFIRFGQGGRFGWYFFLGIIYVLTNLADHKRDKCFFNIFVISLSLVLFLRVSYAWENMNVPYKTFLTNGPTAGNSWMYERYEYDEGYTIDKFYRK